jgi:hypothetical protein
MIELMTAPVAHRRRHRKFVPGTTGWTVDHLDNPDIEYEWLCGQSSAEVRPSLFPGLTVVLGSIGAE